MSITIEKGNKSYPPSNIQVLLCKDNEVLGEVNGYRVDMEYSEVDNSECYEEIYDLIERYPQVLDENGQPRIAELYQADIFNENFRGQGFGIKMYIEFMLRYWNERSKGKPFILIPNGCNLDMEGNNSEDSIRVWKSLSRKFPSSGNSYSTCIAILRKPSNKMAQRVARIHIGQSSLKFVKTFDFSDDDSTHAIEILSEEKKFPVGFVEGKLGFYTRDEIVMYYCGIDMGLLIDVWDIDMGRSWPEKIPVFEILESELDEEYQSQGLGLKMYKALGYLARKDTLKTPMLFIPNYCNKRSTSDPALRVWKSLARSNSVSSGVVILMINRKLR